MHFFTTHRPLAFVLAGLFLVACGPRKAETPKQQEPARTAPPTQKSPAVAGAPVPAPAPTTQKPSASSSTASAVAPAEEIAAPAPPKELRILVSASANSSVQPTVAASWPIVVEVQLMLKPNAGDSLTVTNPKGPWSEAVTIECKGSDGVNHASLFSASYASETSIELTHTRSGLLVWVLESVDLKTLPVGTYQIRALVDEKKLGGTIVASLTSRPVSLTVDVSSAAAANSAGAAQRKCLAMMQAASWKHDLPKSLAIASAYLADNPKDVPVLFVQGKALRAAGKKPEALSSFEAALKAAGENKDPMAENFALERAIVDLEREMAAK